MAMPRRWPRNPYAYMFCYPDGTPYYVGVGKGSRVKYVNRNPWANHIDAKIRRGGQTTLRIIHEVETREEACALECSWIKRFGRKHLDGGLLVNITDGGDGGSAGRVWTTAMRRAVGDAHRNKKWSKARRRAHGIALRGNKNREGIPHSAEVRALISLKGKGKKLRLSRKERIRRKQHIIALNKARTGEKRVFTKEHIANIRKACKERYARNKRNKCK